MALHFDLTGIEDNTTVCYAPCDEGGQIHPRTESFIWATISVGMDRITEKNFMEFYTRVRIRERILGTLLRRTLADGELEDIPTTLEDVRSHIGLKTNADCMTDLQFDKRMMKQLREMVSRV